MARATSGTIVSGSTIYAYVEVDGWSVHSDRCYFNARGGVTSPYYWAINCTGQLKYWENGSEHNFGSGWTDYFGGYGDLELASASSDYFTRGAGDRWVSIGCYVSNSRGSGTAWLNDYFVPHLPSEPTNLSATRVDDNTVTLQWGAPSRSYDKMCLEVAVDGNWQGEIAVLSNSATTYQWSGMAVGHTYQFRARAFYQNAYSNYTTCPTVIYTSPLAPTSIAASAVTGSTDVNVTLENASQTANRLEWRVTSDSAGTEVLLSGYVDGELGTPITSLTIQGIQGEAYIGVRNVHYVDADNHQESSWLTSSKVVTICPPLAPTLTKIPDTVQVGTVTLAWTHNWVDGSAQRKWRLQYKVGEGAYTVVNSTEQTASDTSYQILVTDGQHITWQVRTWGAASTGGEIDNDGGSPWSGTDEFTAYSLPSLSFQSPADEIHVMPLVVEVTFNDTHADGVTGTCNEAKVYIKKGNETKYTENASISGNTISVSVDTSEFPIANNSEYSIVVEALSSTTLRNTATKSLRTNFTEPTYGTLQVTNDPDNGYVSLIATYDNSVTHGKNLLEPKLYTGISYNPTVGTTVAPVESSEQLTAGADGTFTIGTAATWKQYSFVVPCSEDDELYQSVKFSTTGTAFGTTWGYLDADKKVLSKHNDTTMPQTFSGTLIPDEGAAFYYLLFTNRGGATSTITIEKPMISAGTAEQPYEPYVEYVEAVSISVSRINADGTPTPLLVGGVNGSGIVDKYAPLNTPYEYAVTTNAASQAVNTVYVENTFRTDRWYIYWGLDNCIYTEYTSGGVNGTLTFPNRKRVFYSGRKDPVSYNDAAVDFALASKIISFDRKDTEKVMKLMYEGARGVVKTSNGYVYHADFDFGFNDNLKRFHRGELNLTAHKIDGAKL